MESIRSPYARAACDLLQLQGTSKEWFLDAVSQSYGVVSLLQLTFR